MDKNNSFSFSFCFSVVSSAVTMPTLLRFLSKLLDDLLCEREGSGGWLVGGWVGMSEVRS